MDGMTLGSVHTGTTRIGTAAIMVMDISVAAECTDIMASFRQGLPECLPEAAPAQVSRALPITLPEGLPWQALQLQARQARHI